MDKRHEGGELQQARERWAEERLGPALKRVSRAPMPSELRHQPLYTPLDDAGRDYQRDLGFPGEYPYTRGVQPSM